MKKCVYWKDGRCCTVVLELNLVWYLSLRKEVVWNQISVRVATVSIWFWPQSALMSLFNFPSLCHSLSSSSSTSSPCILLSWIGNVPVFRWPLQSNGEDTHLYCWWDLWPVCMTHGSLTQAYASFSVAWIRI